MLDTEKDSDGIKSAVTSRPGTEAETAETAAQTLVLPLRPKPQQDKLEVPNPAEISNDAIELESLAHVATKEVVNADMV